MKLCAELVQRVLYPAETSVLNRAPQELVTRMGTRTQLTWLTWDGLLTSNGRKVFLDI